MRAMKRREVVVQREHEAQPLDGHLVPAQMHELAPPRRLGEPQLPPDQHRAPDDVPVALEQAARRG